MADAFGERPVVEMLALCEQSQLLANGRPQLGGMFSRVGVAQLPVEIQNRTIALEVWGRPFQTVTLSMRLTGPSFGDGLGLPPFEVEIEPHGYVTFGALVNRLPLTAEGVHALEVLWEGEVLRRTRFLVSIVPGLEGGGGLAGGGALESRGGGDAGTANG